jgi:hypothetical protein
MVAVPKLWEQLVNVDDQYTAMSALWTLRMHWHATCE